MEDRSDSAIGSSLVATALRRNARYRAFYYGERWRNDIFSSAVFTSVGPAVTSVLVEAKWVLTARRDGIYCHRVLCIFCDLMGISIVCDAVKLFSSRALQIVSATVCNRKRLQWNPPPNIFNNAGY